MAGVGLQVELQPGGPRHVCDVPADDVPWPGEGWGCHLFSQGKIKMKNQSTSVPYP